MDDVAGLRQALQELDRRWGEIAERCDPAAWRNSGDVADRVRLHRQEIDRLRRAVVEKAATLLRDGFTPLAHRIVGALGRQQWPERPPEPPDFTELPVGVRPSKMARDLFGVEDNDTLEAGMRFLLWGAMAHEPTAFRRPMGWAETIDAWAELLTVRLPLGDVDETTRRPLGDGYRTAGQPMQWALKAFEALVSAGGAARGEATAVKRRKRSTERGEGRKKLLAALTMHHRYADNGCLNLEPIGNNELARLARVDQATASAFFKQKFKGHGKYKMLCADTAGLIMALKLLNDELCPYFLYGGKPRGDE